METAEHQGMIGETIAWARGLRTELIDQSGTWVGFLAPLYDLSRG